MAAAFQKLQKKARRSGRLRGIAPAEWPVLARAWLGLLGVDLMLRCKGYDALRRWPFFRVRPGATRMNPLAAVDLDRMYHLVAIAGRHHLYPMLCLRRALTLQWLLARAGVATELHLGVARGEAGIDAHAWLECQGRVIGETRQEIARYQRLQGGSGSV